MYGKYNIQVLTLNIEYSNTKVKKKKKKNQMWE